ncbi:DUF7124 domain-containing protein [Haloferax elongans]
MPSSDLTLAFSLASLDELSRPRSALEDATRWATYVGIVSSEPSYVERRRVREAEYPQDFLSGPRSKVEALETARDNFQTQRYLFVGVSTSDEQTASDAGWAYKSITDAANAADWSLRDVFPSGDDWLQRENSGWG